MSPKKVFDVIAPQKSTNIQQPVQQTVESDESPSSGIEIAKHKNGMASPKTMNDVIVPTIHRTSNQAPTITPVTIEQKKTTDSEKLNIDDLSMEEGTLHDDERPVGVGVTVTPPQQDTVVQTAQNNESAPSDAAPEDTTLTESEKTEPVSEQTEDIKQSDTHPQDDPTTSTDTPQEEPKKTSSQDGTEETSNEQTAVDESHAISREAIKENEQNATAPTAPFEASDALPDAMTQKTTQLTDTMQSPRIYDTKEYIVPIKATQHSHGVLGMVIAAVISVVIVLAIVYVVVIYIL